ncbi:MAG: hypothetical protein MRZ28_10785 [Oscillospiraceae bacterium]|nr:hypothetical protein [Oscillospiraceae bacterium]MCM0704235.1 hypothetical protein [Faecalicatena sp. BF-R-105]MDY3218596.1 hypothetical protein [Candidatus Fimivivens sp.]SFJ03808.1 hypothetical protein SAMN02910435_01225 [Ruminococcaceae bacterium D5]GKH50745.1 hypothetical protein CE91St46_18560 [Eubacteriales bacterium]
MKQSELEQQFEQELLQNSRKAESECGCRFARLTQTVSRYGGLGTAKALFRRKTASEGFSVLQQAGRLDLSLEATAVKTKYASLFTDEEINHCLSLLCEGGHYRAR